VARFGIQLTRKIAVARGYIP
jgi:hypothetical protein